MNTQGIRETVVGSSKLLLLVFRHIVVAPLVSFVISYAALLPGLFLIVLFGQHLGRALCFTLVGFCGVFMGARCVPQASRGLAAVGLTLLGSIYYASCVAEWGDVMTDEGKFVDAHDSSLVVLILLAFGGLLAITLIAWLSSKSRQPTPRDTFPFELTK